MTALAAASLLAAPAHAQSGPPPGSVPSGWQFDRMDNALQSAHTGNVSGDTNPATAQDAAPSGASAAGTARAWFKWNGTGTPTPLSVLLNASASGNPMPGVSSVSVDDGLGDLPAANWPPGLPGPTFVSSSGKHLQQYSGTGTEASFPVTLSATGNGFANVFVNLSASLDTRGVTISCPTVDGTSGSSYKYPPITGQVITNIRLSDGTMRGDTVKPSQDPTVDAETLTYVDSPIGSWGTSSQYLSYSSLTGYSSSGTFTLPNDSPTGLNAEYSAFLFGYGSSANQGQDHVYTHLTDANDGANATSNYYMHFHDEWEPVSWPADGGTYQVTKPDSEVPSWPTPEWKAVSPAVTIQAPYGTSQVFGYKEAGVESVDGGLELGHDPVVAEFGFSLRPTAEISNPETLTPSPPLSLGYMTWEVYRPIVQRTKGHLDHYGVNGYAGLGAWRHDIEVGIEPSFYTYQPTGTAPTDPPAGWYPPGDKS